jgi:hypothetical protein
VTSEGEVICVTRDNGVGSTGHGRGDDPIVVGIATDPFGQRSRLAPGRVLAIERQDGQIVGRQAELLSQYGHDLVPEHLRQGPKTGFAFRPAPAA